MRTQKGILSQKTNPFQDADVIMTAAIVGHSIRRLHKGNVNECKYCFEVEFENGTKVPLKKTEKTWRAMEDAINKINLVILKAGKAELTGVSVGHTPEHKIADGKIIGGSGDQAPWSLARFSPPRPNPWESRNFEAVRGAVYQGSGAYTGFVFNRFATLPDAEALPTVRITLPNDPCANRWHPNKESFECTKKDGKSSLGPLVGGQHDERVWGMIGSHDNQNKLQADHMQFIPNQQPTAFSDVVGYTHGMIRAIYNIEECRITHPGKDYLDYGTPYEVAVGDNTTKLGSCFACAIFMEASGYPASATHLGQCASWCPQYPADGDESPAAKAVRDCNKKWFKYCGDILFLGYEAIARSNAIVKNRKNSFAALKKVLYFPQEDNSFANLILDAITIHDKDFQRVNRTLKAL